METVKGNVSFLLISLLMGVAMVTLTVTVIHIMQGDRDSAKKFLTWLVATSVGIILMRVIAEPQATWEINKGIGSVVSAIGGILRVMMLIGAAVSLVIVIFRMMKGERESASHILYWLAGFAGGTVLLSLLLTFFP